MFFVVEMKQGTFSLSSFYWFTFLYRPLYSFLYNTLYNTLYNDRVDFSFEGNSNLSPSA